MNSVFRKLFAAILVFLVVYPMDSHAQDLTGIWKGWFKTNDGQHYKLEFQIKQNASKNVTGVSYSWGASVQFYGKATMSGKFADVDGGFQIQEIKTVEVQSVSGGTCIMNYKFTYSKSGKEEFLEGTYVGKTEDRVNPKNNGVWGDCGGGTVFLRRVQSSEFYVEPFLREKIVEKTPPPKDTIRSTVTTSKPITKPPAKPPVKKPPVTNSTTKKTVVVKPPVVNKSKTDTARKKTSEQTVITKPVEKPKIIIPTTIRSRTNELTQTFTVTSEEINVRLYDNGEIDGDTISVYLDGKPILVNKRLSTTPISLNLKLDSENPEHTLVMVAENLGKIPPNTSLMIVQDGDKRFQVSITSTIQKNAMVRFRYEKK